MISCTLFYQFIGLCPSPFGYYCRYNHKYIYFPGRAYLVSTHIHKIIEEKIDNLKQSRIALHGHPLPCHPIALVLAFLLAAVLLAVVLALYALGVLYVPAVTHSPSSFSFLAVLISSVLVLVVHALLAFVFVLVAGVVLVRALLVPALVVLVCFACRHTRPSSCFCSCCCGYCRCHCAAFLLVATGFTWSWWSACVRNGGQGSALALSRWSLVPRVAWWSSSYPADSWVLPWRGRRHDP